VTEAEAVEAVRGGSPAGLEFLMAEYEVRALRLAYTITGDRAGADEVVAEAFLKAYRNIDRFDPDRRFGPWFLKIVTNEALQYIRKARRTERLHALLGRQERRSPDPVEVAEANEVRRQVAAAIRELPGHERAAITLRYLLDMDEKAVAETLGLPLGTLKTRLHRARVRLRERLGGDLRVAVAPEEGAR
jgi:RNA polymerase sigma-70 factor (ECF subfamily)